MKKQFILSAALASSVLYSPCASAVINIRYDNSTDTFNVDGRSYNTIHEVNLSIGPRVLAGEKTRIDPASQGKYFKALFDDTDTQRDFVTLLNYSRENVTFDEFRASATRLKQDLNILGITTEQLSNYIDLNSVLDDHNIEDIEDALDFIHFTAQRTLNSESQMFATIIASNPELGDLKAKANSAGQQHSILKAAGADSSAIEAAYKAYKEALSNLYSRTEFDDVRKSKANQEGMKSLVEQIKLLQTTENFRLQGLAENYVKELESVISAYAPNTNKASELTPIQTQQTKATETMQAAGNAIRSVIDRRLSGIAAGIATGISSGDMVESYGVWAKGTLSTGQQKTKGLSDGHKFDLAAITIGADIGEDNLIGVAYTYANANVKSSLNKDNKDEIPMNIGSIYGMVTQGNIFVQGQAHYGVTKMTKRRATGDLQSNIVKAKPKGTSIGGSAQIGYDYVITEGASLIPTIGVSYNDNKVNGYTETGKGLTTKVAKRAASRTSGLAGLSYRHNIESDKGSMVPEIHANVDYALSSKNDSTKITLVTGMDPIVVGAEKPVKATYNLGGSLQMLTHGGLEAGIGYDFGFAQKYQSHTGTVKVRLNF